MTFVLKRFIMDKWTSVLDVVVYKKPGASLSMIGYLAHLVDMRAFHKLSPYEEGEIKGVDTWSEVVKA